MLRGSSLLIPRLPLSALQPRTSWNKMSGLTSPICPKFIPVEDGENAAMNKSSGSRFRLVSYNLLAQVYVKSSLFPHSPSSCLRQQEVLNSCNKHGHEIELKKCIILTHPINRWKVRSQAIMTVLKSFEADFLCLQELDEFDSFYKGNMEKHGYSSVYIRRSGQKRDGCGIFYKPSSAELVLKEEIEYNDLVNPVACGSTINGNGNENLLDVKVARDMPVEGLSVSHETNPMISNKLYPTYSQNKSSSDDRGDLSDPRVRLKRDCVGILAAFKLNDPSHHVVIVANTHIYWDPKLADVKLAQAEHLLLRLSHFKEVVSKEYSCIPSIIVAGDFNSTPGDKVYQCLVSGRLKLPISLCSFYAHIREEPPFTNCTPDFTGTLDYIFFSNNSRLKPVGFLEIPEPDSPNVLGGLPNHHHPSDHLPIGGDFEVTDA